MHYAGCELPDLPEGEIAIASVVLIKVIKADGSVAYREHRARDLHPMEALGMATSFTDTMRHVLMDGMTRG